nr:MAG TPA: hypothetical protein [Caudoviricetes sp.]
MSRGYKGLCFFVKHFSKTCPYLSGFAMLSYFARGHLCGLIKSHEG